MVWSFHRFRMDLSFQLKQNKNLTFHEWAYNFSQLAWYNIPYIYFGMNEINQNCQCIYMDWPRKIANLTKFLFLIVFAWDSERISARNSPPILQKRRTKVGILCVATIYLLLGLVNVCNSVKYSFNASTSTHCTVLNLVRINLVVIFIFYLPDLFEDVPNARYVFK